MLRLGSPLFLFASLFFSIGANADVKSLCRLLPIKTAIRNNAYNVDMAADLAKRIAAEFPDSKTETLMTKKGLPHIDPILGLAAFISRDRNYFLRRQAVTEFSANHLEKNGPNYKICKGKSVQEVLEMPVFRQIYGDSPIRHLSETLKNDPFASTWGYLSFVTGASYLPFRDLILVNPHLMLGPREFKELPGILAHERQHALNARALTVKIDDNMDFDNFAKKNIQIFLIDEVFATAAGLAFLKIGVERGEIALDDLETLDRKLYLEISKISKEFRQLSDYVFTDITSAAFIKDPKVIEIISDHLLDPSNSYLEQFRNALRWLYFTVGDLRKIFDAVDPRFFDGFSLARIYETHREFNTEKADEFKSFEKLP